MLADPLRPSGGQARRALARELVGREYRRSPFDIVKDWLARRMENVTSAAGDVGWLQLLLGILFVLLVGLAIAWLASRARRTARTKAPAEAVLIDSTITAAQWRERAQQAMLTAQYGQAVVDAYRAIAAGQVERGRLGDLVGATAQEVARLLTDDSPGHGAQISQAAHTFDAVLYGDHEAGAHDAQAVLDLDRSLMVTR